MLPISVALMGCDRVTPAPLAGPAYPSLHDVPPRPERAATVQQREEIAARLIRDRADARSTNQAIRHRTGLTDVPPPAPPPVPVTPAPPPVAIAPEAVVVRPPVPAALDDADSLNDFLRRLVERAETAAPFEAPAVFPDEPLAPSPAEPAGEAAPLDVRPPEPEAGPEAAAEALLPVALFPAQVEAEADAGARLLAWVGQKLRALAGTSGSAPVRPLHPALVPVAVTGPDDLRRRHTTPALASAATPPTVGPSAPPMPALKPAATTGADGGVARRTAERGPAARTVLG